MSCRCEGPALCNHGERCPKERAHAHLPERRVQFDEIHFESPLLCRVLAGLICFWLALVFGVPALLNAVMRGWS